MRIINSTYFTRNNNYNLPLAESIPSSYESENNSSDKEAIEILCNDVEQELLLNSVGLVNYDFIQSITDLSAVDEKWKWLIEGHKYDDKWWKGLKDDYSCIVSAVYYLYLNDMQHVSAIGTTQIDPEKAKIVTPAYKIANACNDFFKTYQGERKIDNCVSVSNYRGINFRDYSHQANSLVSLKEFLNDHKELFELDKIPFVEYNHRFNSFGL